MPSGDACAAAVFHIDDAPSPKGGEGRLVSVLVLKSFLTAPGGGGAGGADRVDGKFSISCII